MKVEMSFPMSEQMYDIIFPKHNINTKRELLIVLLEVTRYIIDIQLYGVKFNAYDNCEIFLLHERTSRLYFVSGDKQYSIGFPFTIGTNDSNLISTVELAGLKLTPIVIIATLQILKNDDLWKSNDFFEFASGIDYWCDQFRRIPEEYGSADVYWPFFLDLMLYDDGYLRYDYDPIHFRQDNPNYHPLHHLHGGFHGDVAYRVSLTPPFNLDDFKDISNVNTNSWKLVQ